jgi:hypothetical protein
MTRSVPRPIYILLGFMMSKGGKTCQRGQGLQSAFSGNIIYRRQAALGNPLICGTNSRLMLYQKKEKAPAKGYYNRVFKNGLNCFARIA